MKILLTGLTSFFILLASGYSQSKLYNTFGAEMLFSSAVTTDQGADGKAILRWEPVINIQSNLNKDVSEHFGWYAGFTLRNVGYTYDNYLDPKSQGIYEKVFRSYNIGIPVGLKFGNLASFYVFAGYEFELPFAYKEKTFEDGTRINKTTVWFSDRQKHFNHGVMVGAQLTQGANITFKYYLNEFHNQDFVDEDGLKPYEGLKSNIFYVSLGYMLFRELE